MDYDERTTEPLAVTPPGWRLVLSALVLVHFAAIGVHILAVRSGPWPMFEGPGSDFADAPIFVRGPLANIAQKYLSAIRLEETGRYPSFKNAAVQVKMEAILYDAEGKETERLTWPNESAWPWVRQLESHLAQALANDVMRPPLTGEKSYPKGQEPPKIPVWRSPKPEDPIQQLTWVPEHLLAREPSPTDWGPEEWGLALSRSYARYLCRTHGAAACELRRRWKYQKPPFVMMAGEPLEKAMFEERISTYGKVSDATAP